MNEVREAAVAGQFYPDSHDKLLRDVKKFLNLKEAHPIHALGVVVPHAGYTYSGPVAGALYARVQIPKRAIILCPNHTGMGAPLAITSRGRYRTPLGELAIDTALAEALKQGFALLREDSLAQQQEHAVEVHLPFLQVLQPELQFVPITVGTGQFEVVTALGVVLAKAIADYGEPVLIIASSDMNHYEDDAKTRVKDALAIEQVLSLDPAGLFETVRRNRITMCGVGPAAAMLTATLRLGAHTAELVRYGTSGDTSGEHDRVVGYAGILVR